MSCSTLEVPLYRRCGKKDVPDVLPRPVRRATGRGDEIFLCKGVQRVGLRKEAVDTNESQVFSESRKDSTAPRWRTGQTNLTPLNTPFLSGDR